jgi:hypothetical protein
MNAKRGTVLEFFKETERTKWKNEKIKLIEDYL